MEQTCVILSLNKFSVKQKMQDWVYIVEGAIGIRCSRSTGLCILNVWIFNPVGSY